MYHKVDVVTPSRWWVSVDRFRNHMESLVDQFEIVYLDDYQPGSDKQVVITFDDAYENVHTHAAPILNAFRIPFEVFVIGDKIGGWNQFDSVEMTTRFCGIEQLDELVEAVGRLQWHSKRHLRLTKVSEPDLLDELEVDSRLKERYGLPHFNWLSYPYGLNNELIRKHAKSRFKGAVAVEDGDAENQYALPRAVADMDWQVPGSF